VNSRPQMPAAPPAIHMAIRRMRRSCAVSTRLFLVQANSLIAGSGKVRCRDWRVLDRSGRTGARDHPRPSQEAGWLHGQRQAAKFAGPCSQITIAREGDGTIFGTGWDPSARELRMTKARSFAPMGHLAARSLRQSRAQAEIILVIGDCVHGTSCEFHAPTGLGTGARLQQAKARWRLAYGVWKGWPQRPPVLGAMDRACRLKADALHRPHSLHTSPSQRAERRSKPSASDQK